MTDNRTDDNALRSVALENSRVILAERRRFEQQMLESKADLQSKTEDLTNALAMTRAILDATTDAILATDGDRRITGMNARYCALWQLPDAVIGTFDHDAYLKVCATRMPDPVAFLTRIDEIYNSGQDETYDLLTLVDGRVLERFSRLQQLGGGRTGRVWTLRDVTQRTVAEETLRKSNEFNRTIIESTPDCIKTLTLDGAVLWINPAGCAKLCIDNVSAVLGKQWVEFWQDDDRTAALNSLGLARLGKTGSFLGSLKIPGENRLYDVMVSPIFGVNQKPEKLLAVSRDVTDRKRIEMELRKTEAHFRALADAMPQIVWTAYADGKVDYFNRRWYEFTGHTYAPPSDEGWMSVLHPDDLEHCLRLWSRSVATGEPYEIEYRFKHRTGIYRWHLGRALPLRDESGAIHRWYGSSTDIHDYKLVEENLRDESDTLELMNKSGQTLASTLDLQELLQSVTDAGTQLSGAQFGAFFYTVRDKNGDNLQLYTLSGAPREAFEKFGHPRATPIFAPTFQGEAPIRSDDIQKDPRYGHVGPHFGMPEGHLPVRSYLSLPVKSRSGEVIGGLFFGHSATGVFNQRSERVLVGVAAQAAIAIDNARLYDQVKRASAEKSALLDAEREARAEAERVSRMKDEFLAMLSHELRTPLNAILGWSQLLLTEDNSSDDLRTGLETINRNARSQTQLIEDLLDMSRIVSGKIRLDVQFIDATDVVNAAVDSIRVAAEAKGLRLRKIIEPQSSQVNGDPGRLQQILWNLLSNAIKFTPKGGFVDVVMKCVDSHIEISVTDSGTGISADFLPHVFERFRQADSSLTRKHGGLGLGLSISKQLVELHGGQISATSLGPGQGSTFTVILPQSAELADRERKHLTSELQGADFSDAVDLSGIKVLVVDDEQDAQTLLRKVLERHHATVKVAASAKTGLQLLQDFVPDVLLSDIGMPDQDGYQFIDQVRSLTPHPMSQIPAAALTAFARTEDRSRAIRAGFQIHISKPIDPHELLVTVSSLAKRRTP